MIDEELLKQASDEFQEELDAYMAEWEASLREALESDAEPED